MKAKPMTWGLFKRNYKKDFGDTFYYSIEQSGSWDSMYAILYSMSAGDRMYIGGAGSILYDLNSWDDVSGDISHRLYEIPYEVGDRIIEKDNGIKYIV